MMQTSSVLTVRCVMSRYIDADEAEKWLRAGCAYVIRELPSIDIVRCKECVHGTYCEEADMYICNANDQDLYEAEHFCSYGERREP